MAKKFNKWVLSSLVLPAILNFSGCPTPGINNNNNNNNDIQLREKSPEENTITLKREESKELKAVFESKSYDYNLEALVNDSEDETVNKASYFEDPNYIITMKKTYSFDKLGTYDIEYNAFVDNSMVGTDWTINVINSLPEIYLYYRNGTNSIYHYYVDEVDFMETETPYLYYGFSFKDSDSMDSLEKSAKLYYHGDYVQDLNTTDVNNELIFPYPGNYEIVVSADDSHDKTEKISEIFYSSHEYFDSSKKYDGETSDYVINDISNLETILDKYYNQENMILLDTWKDFFSKANPNTLLYNDNDNHFNYMTSDLSEILVGCKNEDLVNSLVSLTQDITRRDYETLVNKFMPKDALIFHDKELNFKDLSNNEVSINLDHYISSSGQTYGLVYNPTDEERSLIDDYNSIFEGYSNITPITDDLTRFGTAQTLNNLFD